MIVIKRNKKAQEFNEAKLMSSIFKSFESCGSKISTEEALSIINSLNLEDGIRTEDLQKRVENQLMKLGYYNEARFFIIWRHINYYEKTLANKVKFMRSYLDATNAATGSKYDANANVTEKNIATLNGELYKGDIIKLNRYRLYNKIESMYGKELANEYLRQLESHELYKHDESSIMPYCVAITMYPYLLSGLSGLGGLSSTPKNLDSFCGSFINLVFAVSAQFAGAVATGEFLLYFDYFCRKDFGEDYYQHGSLLYLKGAKVRALEQKSGKFINTKEDLVALSSLYPEEISELLSDTQPKNILDEGLEDNLKLSDGTRSLVSWLTQKFQQIVYSMNQPAASRNFQSTFWNISYFDKNYFEGLFGNFVFPDMTSPVWDSLNWLQKIFMRWFNKERTLNLLTFPVETMAMLTDGKDIIDKEYADFAAEMYSKGHSFFTYLSDNPDSLSSCCRLRNEISENQFSYSLGAGGIATGSKSVMTLNLNRLVQMAINNKINYLDFIRENVVKVQKYQIAFNELIKEYFEKGALPVYSSGFISLNKQYLTLGINGLVEAAEFLGIPIRPCKEYNDFVDSILRIFKEENKRIRTKEIMMNTEFVPAENLGVKNRKWDAEAGFKVPESRNCYNSYFYPSEDTSLTLIDKFKLHGKDYVKFLDGGSALHMNLDEHLSKEQYRKILTLAVVYGTNYFTFNIPNTICNDCNNIDKRYLSVCPKCGSTNIDYATRVIGYLKRVSNFSEARQEEAGKRYYLKPKNI